MKRFLGLTALAVMLSLTACGGKDEAASVEKAADSLLLEYVPADSPYVYGALAPSPDDVADKLETLIDAVMPAFKAQLDVAREGIAMAGEGESEDAATVIDALAKRMTPEIAETFGFSREDTAVFYGNGLLPVARITLTDEAQFESELAAIAEEIGKERVQKTLGDDAFDVITFGDALSILVGVQDGMVVMALAPASLDDDALGELVGATKPSQSIAAGGALTALADKYSYVAQGLGYIDLEAIAGVFLDGPTGLDAKLLEATGAELPELTDACRAEIRGLTQIAPRLTLGYQRLDTEVFEMLPVMELRSDLAQAMQPIATNVPGLNDPGTGMMKFAIAMDLKELRSFVEAQVEKIMAAPYECEELGTLNMGAMQAQEALSQPLPPIAYNFKGLVFDINNIDGIDFENPGMPENLDLSVLLAFDNVSALLQMGQMFLPPLAMVEIAPDGEPVEIPQEMLQGYPASVFAAMSDNLLSFSTGGSDSEGRAKAMVAASSDGEPAVMAMSVDMAAYMGFISDIQQSAIDDIMADAADADSEEGAAAARLAEASLESNQAIQDAYGKVFDRETVHIRITPNGFELPTTITLK
ncbi:MAG: hypothetical protein AAF545_15420 [Pseudomonadota bacterium]